MKSNIELSLQISNTKLLLPIRDTDKDSKVELKDKNGQTIIQFTIKLSEKKPDYYIPIDVEQYLGQEITLLIQSKTVKETVVNHIKQQNDHQHNHEDDHRPMYHYSSPFGWINDPNGLFYSHGKYHLYFQHNPYGVRWGNMSWGHAYSEDLIHWQTQPVAMLPNQLGDIFSGSIIIDKKNAAGFGKDAILAFYTSAGATQVQSLAYSTDNGQTFLNYEHNPILTDSNYIDFRDPKVFWHKESKKWIMSLATTQTITFYSSTNLKEWEKLSEFGQKLGNHNGVWECPDLFALPYGKTKKWVLFVSINPGGPNGGNATQYFIGDFDGQTFTPDPLPYPLYIDYGRDNYAGVCWHNSPKEKAIYIGWMSNWDYANEIPSKIFKNAMTLPRTLEFGLTNKHLIVKNYPSKEAKKLRKEKKEFSNRLLERSVTKKSFLEDNMGAFELDLDFNVIDVHTTKVTLTLFNNDGEKLVYIMDLCKRELLVDRSESGLVDFSNKFTPDYIRAPFPTEKLYKLKLFIDKASSELFVNKGKIAVTNVIFPKEPYNNITIDVESGVIDITKFRVYRLEC